jgi:hypothetical protein
VPDEATTTAASQPSRPLSVEWNRIDDLEVFSGGRLAAVSLTSSGFVAVGTDELPADAAVWVSADGTSWTRVVSDAFSGVADDNGVDGDQHMNDVIETIHGTVAVGAGEFSQRHEVDAGVWILRETEWERVEHESLTGEGSQQAATIIEFHGGLYAAGSSESAGNFMPVVWSSADGVDWEVATGAAFDQPGVILDLVSTSDFLLGVGLLETLPPRPAVWITRDGATWELIDSSQGSIEVPDTTVSTFMRAVTIGSAGFIAVGAAGDPSAGLVWVSSDGFEWDLAGELIDSERPSNPVFPSSVVATDRGVTAVGIGPVFGAFPPFSYAEAWVSREGTTWSHVERTSSSTVALGPGAPWHVGAFSDVIAVGSGLLAVGLVPFQDATLPGPFFRQAVWVGTWTERP